MAKKQAAFFAENFDSDVPVKVLGGEAPMLPGSSTYQPVAACNFCGQFEAIDCLRGGSAESVDPARVGVELGFSRDSQLIVSTRVLDVLRSVAAVDIEAFAIGPAATATHWVVLPKHVFVPPEPIQRRPKGAFRFPATSPFLRHQDPCTTCGRYGDVTFNLEWVSLPPETTFAGLRLARRGTAGNWVRIYSPALADVLKSASIPKLRFQGLENRWETATHFPTL